MEVVEDYRHNIALKHVHLNNIKLIGINKQKNNKKVHSMKKFISKQDFFLYLGFDPNNNRLVVRVANPNCARRSLRGQE